MKNNNYFIHKNLSINEILSKVRHIEFKARKLVEEILSNEYRSVFKGRGIEFFDVRNYYPEDDIRDIDWNVTARMNDVYVKTYIEERELTIYFVIDISGSLYFGNKTSKREIISEIVALLGFAAFYNNDKIGLILFTDKLEKIIPPRKNYSHLLRIIRDTLCFNPIDFNTNISISLMNVLNMIKKRSIIFIISDFLDKGYEKPLTLLARKHDIIPIIINDQLEENINLNTDNLILNNIPIFMELEDIETQKIKTVDLNFSQFTEILKYREYYRRIFNKLNLDYVEVNDSIDYFKKIENLLRKRIHKIFGGYTATMVKNKEKDTIIVKDRKGSKGKLYKCAEIIKNGGLVIFPTETVYGLGANAYDFLAVKSIFKVKGRPQDNPLIVHISKVDDLDKVATNIPTLAIKLFEEFSPGPLTIVLDKNSKIPFTVTAGLSTVAVRIPSHPVARKLIELAGVPIAAPSANISGKPSPTNFEMCYNDMYGKVDAIIDGGECEIGLESTVIKVENNNIKILRPGSITEEMLRVFLAKFEDYNYKLILETLEEKSIKEVYSPGVKYKHYQPNAVVYLCNKIDINKIMEIFPNKKIGVLTIENITCANPDICINNFDSLNDYARNLYKIFYEFDKINCDIIIAQAIEEKGIGKALMNRLYKASQKKYIDNI